LFLRISQKNKDVYAGWWDDTWMYRQSINISSHTSDETNVFITATIGLGSTDKAQADAGDFRFLNSTGQILPYYIVSGAGTTSITFHINLDSFPRVLKHFMLTTAILLLPMAFPPATSLPRPATTLSALRVTKKSAAAQLLIGSLTRV